MRAKCGGFTFHQGHCCAGLLSPNKALEDTALVCFTQSTCNIPPIQGSMYLLKFMPQTNSAISLLQIGYMTFTAKLSVPSCGRRWDYTPGQEKTATKRRMSSAVLLSLKAYMLRELAM